MINVTMGPRKHPKPFIRYSFGGRLVHKPSSIWSFMSESYKIPDIISACLLHKVVKTILLIILYLYDMQ